MALMFNDDFGFAVDSDFAKTNLICDVLLTNSDLSTVLRESSIDSTSYDHGRSPGMDSLEFCVPTDEGDSGMGDTGVHTGPHPGYDMHDQDDSPQHCPPGGVCAPGPIAAPLQNFPSVDVGYLRRRCKAEASTTITTTKSPAPSGGRRRAESDPVPLRQSMRADTRKRRIDDQGRRTAMMELSEEERLEKNRQSARDCRLRKKRYIENLERRISEYEKREIVLTSTIARLEEQLAATLSAAKMPGSV